MVNEPMSKETPFNAMLYLLLKFFFFFLILNTALDLSMLVQEGTICISAKEICAPWKSTEQLAGWMKGETEQFLQDREYICCFRCFTGCA